MPPWRTVRRVYLGLAVLWLNASLLFIAANVVALAYAALRGNSAAAVAPRGPDPARLKQLLPEIGDGAAIFSSEISREIMYEPFTQFRERPFAGRYVNVDPAGFRPGRGQGPWPPEPAYFNVFLFGRSTIFGCGVPYDYTIGSYLQDRLSSVGLPRHHGSTTSAGARTSRRRSGRSSRSWRSTASCRTWPCSSTA